MNLIRFSQLIVFLAVIASSALQLSAQNDRGPAVNNVPALIQNLSETKPLKRQVERTYSEPNLIRYDPIADHVQGMTRLPDGRYVFTHSTGPHQTEGLIVFSRQNNDAIYERFHWSPYAQTHPSAIQACGNIVAAPNEGDKTSIHFFDATDPNSPVELNHLRITSFSNEDFLPLNAGIDAVGLVYHELHQKHYLTVSKGSESGRADGPVWLFESNGLPLTDPDCIFTYHSPHRFFTAFTSASGFNLIYDASGELYAAALYRNDLGEERLKLQRIDIETASTSAVEIADIYLSSSSSDISPEPGFRWGGGIVVNDPNSIDVIGSARVISGGPGANYCVVKIWKGVGEFEDCRKYSETCWLTTNNAYSSPPAGFPLINSQSYLLKDQLTYGARAFMLDVWDKNSLNAPNAGPGYENLRDEMFDNNAYLLNDPRHLKPNGDCCDGEAVQGVTWPFDLGSNLPLLLFKLQLKEIGTHMQGHPDEIITLFLNGNAGYEALKDALEYQSEEVLALFLNQDDYANLYNRSLGEMRSSGRRLVVFRDQGTMDFTVKGYNIQFRDRFEKTIENKPDMLPIGLNNCDERAESASLNTLGRLLVFNHIGQPYHELIARRWQDHCNDVAIPNFLVVNNFTEASLGVSPEDAVNEFNRRFKDQKIGNVTTYRILEAGGTWNITQQSDEDGAKVVTSDNYAYWEFVLNEDHSYYIRLKGTNRYLTAPANILNACLMQTDPDLDRARWYVEPLGGNTVRLFNQHNYGSVRKAMRLADSDNIKLSDNIDFVDIGAQKFELLPVVDLSASCKPATLILNATGGADLIPDAVKDQVSYSGVCQEELFYTIDRNHFTCADLGNQTVKLTVSNGADLVTSCLATVTVLDNTAPEIDCPPNKIIAANADCTNLLGSWQPYSVRDNCLDNSIVSQSPAANTVLSGHNDTETVTLTVNDGHGNEISCQFQVIMKDQTAPSIQCKNYTASLNASGTVNLTPSDVFQSGTDNCGTVNLLNVIPGTFNCSNIGANSVVLEVNDGHGNLATCLSTVTVVDNIAPTVVCKPFTAILNQAGAATVIPADVFQSGADNCNTLNLVSVSPNAFNCSNLGANTVQLSINDGHGNQASCTTTVTVEDKMSPVIVCKTYTTFLNAAGVVSIIPDNVYQSGTDNCGVVNLNSVSPNSFTCAQIGSNPVTLVVNDGHGNSASCNTFVTVKDAIIPTMQCKNATIYLNSLGQATLSVAQINNGSFDNCSIVAMGLNQTEFNCAHLGQKTVILGAADQSQNKGQCSATVTVLDAIQPVSKCKNITANLDINGALSIATTAVDNGSFDNCSYTQLLSPNTFNCAHVGLNSAVLKTTDASGNFSTCTALITVKDVHAPTALCKNATIFVNDLGEVTLNASQINNNSVDACGISTMTLSKSQFNCSDLPGSAQTVKLTLKDVNNNQSTCTAQVSIKDNLAPTAICQNATVHLGEDGKVTVYGEDLALNSFDNCSVWSYSPAAKLYTTANMGNNNLTITVKDWSGNAATCVAVVTIVPHNNLAPSNNRESDSLNEGFALELFPNPGDGHATLSFQLPGIQSIAIRILDVSGRMVYEQTTSGLAGNNNIPITLNGIAPGVYLIDFQSEGLKAQKRMVVVRN